jgi:photosystem II stability/assembly factor-like uncharacterized protein
MKNTIREKSTKAGIRIFNSRINLLIVMLFMSANSYSQWNLIHNGYDYVIEYAKDSTSIITSEYNGWTLLKTTDFGNSWDTINNYLEAVDIDYHNKDTAFRINVFNLNGNQLKKSVDGGLNWSIIPSSPNLLYGTSLLDFIDANTGFILHYNNPDIYLYSTVDGGINWDTLNITAQFPYISFSQMYFIDHLIGYIINSGDGIYKTIDGGKKWNKILPTTSLISGSGDIDFINPQNGYILSDSILFRTNDGGINWDTAHIFSPIVDNYGGHLLDIDFFDELHGYVCGYGHRIFKTNDGGKNWAYTNVMDSLLGNLYFISVDTGYVLGNQFGLHLTTTGGINTAFVWPGDANSDLIANSLDLLSVGVSYGTTGTARATVSNNWAAQASTDWGTTFSNGIDYKNADCNGDGSINDDDTLAILLNYGLTHNKTSLTSNATASDPDLYLELVKDTANTNDTLHLSINLGTSSIPATNIYGIAFSITYNSAMIDSGSAKVDFSNSWIGDKSNSLSLEKDLYSNGRIDLVFTRKDKQNISGFGNIGELEVVLEDNISGKDTIYKTINFTITDVKVISNTETDVAVNLGHDSVVVQGLAGIVEEVIQDKVKLYPNPTNNQITIELPSNDTYTISIYNSIGVSIFSTKHSNLSQKTIDVSTLPTGVYMLEVKNKSGAKAIKRVVRF